MSQTPLSLAGFQVILIGRFWVIAEAHRALGEVLFFVEGGRIEGERIYEALRSLEQCLLAHQFGLPLKSWSHLRVLVEKALKNGVIDRVREEVLQQFYGEQLFATDCTKTFCNRLQERGCLIRDASN